MIVPHSLDICGPPACAGKDKLLLGVRDILTAYGNHLAVQYVASQKDKNTATPNFNSFAALWAVIIGSVRPSPEGFAASNAI